MLYEKGLYRFICEDGVELLTHADYLGNEELRRRVNDPMRMRLYLGRTIITYPAKYLLQNKAKADTFLEMQVEQERNPLKFFAPSGKGAAGFLNDWHSKILFITAGNRCGKTATAIVKLLLKIIECAKDWPIFTEHGVNRRVFTGPRRVALASYEWGNHQKTLGPEVFKWAPRELVGVYHPSYDGPGSRSINYKDNPILPFTNRSEIHFYAYSQSQKPYESAALQDWGWDEQPPEAKWNGANERVRNFRDAQHLQILTPHSLEGEPETGQDNFLWPVYNGDVTLGYGEDRIARYEIGQPDVADWVLPQESKDESVMQWITEPTRNQDFDKLREGMARVYGKWQQASGLVYSTWSRATHVIEPFAIPQNATLLRYIDHGRVNPCACLWGAVLKEYPHVLILFREYYVKNKLIQENAEAIVHASGNLLVQMDPIFRNGIPYTTQREAQIKERYRHTKLDSRSFSQKSQESHFTVGEVYRRHGLRCTPADGRPPVQTVDQVASWLSVDLGKKNPVTGQDGFTRVLVFDTLVNFIREIEGYIYDVHATRKGRLLNKKDTPKAKDDHLMDCLRWMILDEPRWSPSVPLEKQPVDTRRNRAKKRIHADPYTGY